ncbi:MAG: translation initiation factor IF-2 N-terminal domain-containing protein, partial [Deltaproteobacteria bacterium]|nr:translation initiation factor IF-2 N-terminal domain-containing protein [Deltaproteobacteria bacterium]
MANIRVYELARDLTKTNKELLKTIRELNIPVKSHASSLDKENEKKVREYFFGKKADTVEVTRVKSTVIRRRKKVVPEELVKEEPVKPEGDTSAAETVSMPAPEAPVVEPAESVVPDTPKAPVKKRATPPKEAAAKIITRGKSPAEKAPETKIADQAPPAV